MSRIRIGGAAAKTVTFAMVHFTVAFSIAYLLTGSVGIASALALIEPMANTVAYYFHERIWQAACRKPHGAGSGFRLFCARGES